MSLVKRCIKQCLADRVPGGDIIELPKCRRPPKGEPTPHIAVLEQESKGGTDDEAAKKKAAWQKKRKHKCGKCNKTGHYETECWKAHPQLAPKCAKCGKKARTSRQNVQGRKEQRFED